MEVIVNRKVELVAFFTCVFSCLALGFILLGGNKSEDALIVNFSKVAESRLNIKSCQLLDHNGDGKLCWDNDVDGCGNRNFCMPISDPELDCSSPGQTWSDNGDDINDADSKVCKEIQE